MKVAIVGIGLMGGSLSLDLKALGFASHVMGVDDNKEHCVQALNLKLVDTIVTLKEALEAADLIVLAIPVNAIARVLPQVLDNMKESATVTDLGSTKKYICDSVSMHPKRLQYVASHPMAGTEFSGPQAAICNLFQTRAVVICEKDKSGESHLQCIEKMYQTLNMRLVYMPSDEHDLHVAYVSHLSHISSFALANAVLDKEKNSTTIFDLASGGFESTVRLAKSSPDMWTPIFEQNSSQVIEALEVYIEHIQKFKQSLENSDFEKIRQLMERSNEIRRVLNTIGGKK